MADLDAEELYAEVQGLIRKPGVPFGIQRVLRDLLTLQERTRAELDALRSIRTGRTTGPTDVEIDSHAAAGGKWWVYARWSRGGAEKSANVIHSWAPGVARYLRDGQPDARWWALDASWAPCAWPEVSDG